jgi:DNA-binding transcriptional ArsR family regulator
MTRWYAQLDPEERSKQTIMKILSFLPEDKEVSWGELEKKAKEEGMSKASLSKHLKTLSELGLVERRVDTSTYPPRTYYRKINKPIMRRTIPADFGELLEELLFDNTVPFDSKLFHIEVALVFLKIYFEEVFTSQFYLGVINEIKSAEEERKKALEMIIEQGYTFENFQKTCDNVLHVIINFTLAYGYPEKILKVYETLEKELVHDISRMREQVKRYIELRGGSADSALMKLIDKLEKEKSNAQQSLT